jgi:hypothetical protein
MKSKWIDHNGHRVFLCDYTDYKSDIGDLKSEVAFAQDMLGQEPPNSVLELVEVQNMPVSTEVTHLFKSAAIAAKPHLRKTAVVGVPGIVNLLMQAFARATGLQFRLFDDVDSAKDWLVD